MTASAQHSYGTRAGGSYSYADEVYASLDVRPDDRIGPSRRRRVGVSLIVASLLLGALGTAWVMLDGQSNWPRWWSEARALAAPLLERVATAAAPLTAPETAAKAPPSAPPSEAKPLPGPAVAGNLAVPDPSTPAAAAPIAVPSAVEQPERTVAAAPPVAAVEEPSAAAAKKTLESDPNLARAIAAGLHPDMSRVLLTRLSKADYQNAAVAIKTALAETADDQVLFWPKKAKAGLAIFRVHFVPGAEPDCRRYVVTVAKDGWQTTALPMDNCTIKRSVKKPDAAPQATASHGGDG